MNTLLRETFEERYVALFGEQKPRWNMTYEEAFHMKVIRKEQMEEYQARGFVYAVAKIDEAWKIYEAGFWNGAAAEATHA